MLRSTILLGYISESNQFAVNEMLVTELLNLLREHVNHRIRNGEITERGLARLTGLSQSHVHNVLKGARMLTPEVADTFLRYLRISVLELLGDAAGEMRFRKGPGRAGQPQADPRKTSL
jgi:transcriptional regulator with XRE-family HTH domain